MSFNPNEFYFDYRGNHYYYTTDSFLTVEVSGYFNPMLGALSIYNSRPLARGDKLKVYSGTDGYTTDYTLTAVSSAAGVVLDTGSFTASLVGSNWAAAPDVIQFQATLVTGGSAGVILEVRDALLSASTAATIIADTTAQVLTNAVLSRNSYQYRFRQTSGGGTVTITV